MWPISLQPFLTLHLSKCRSHSAAGLTVIIWNAAMALSKGSNTYQAYHTDSRLTLVNIRKSSGPTSMSVHNVPGLQMKSQCPRNCCGNSICVLPTFLHWWKLGRITIFRLSAPFYYENVVPHSPPAYPTHKNKTNLLSALTLVQVCLNIQLLPLSIRGRAYLEIGRDRGYFHQL